MKNVASFVFILIAATAAFSQDNEITAEKYRRVNLDAWRESRSFDRRITQKSEIYEDGKVKETTSLIWEYLLPDRRRVVEETTADGKTKRVELIEIGKSRYCKRGDEEWTIKFGSCVGGSGSGGPDPILDRYTRSEETVDGQKLKRYRHLTTHRGWSEDDGRTYFWETTFWVDAKGRLVKEEERRGVSVPYSLTSHRVETCEFEPVGLKIEAPIVP